MIILTDTEVTWKKKKSNNISWKKTLRNLIVKGDYLMVKGIYEKATTSIKLNSEKLKAFPLRLGAWQRYPFVHLLFSVVVEILTWARGQEREIGVPI